ncbi:MAG: DsbA family protein, partial [Polyangiaceae bacterium]|nr:DsbA family protein [Polyangiaceae bacterium]
MSEAPLQFYFDFISPYAYLAWKAVGALAARHGRVVEPAPILFAALLNAHGQKGPAEIAPKRVYIFKHTSRLAAQAGLPLAPPPTHPFNPLLSLRVASLPLPPGPRHALIDALFDAAWGGQGGVETPEQVTAAAARAGLDGAALVAQASSPEGKARLREQTERA